MPAKPLHLSVRDFVRAHLGKDAFAPHTGSDRAAWNAFPYLVECWTFGGGELAMEAMRAVVRCAQRRTDILQTFVQAIPAVGDWSHVRALWPEIAAGIVLHDGGDARCIRAVERTRFYRGDSKVLEEDVQTHGWSAT